jgi:hypothetical protein
VITKQQIKLVEEIHKLCSQLHVETDDFPESAHKFIYGLKLNANWVHSQLIYTGDIPYDKPGRKPKLHDPESEEGQTY